uniref:CCN family member 2-like n=1 Tax=Styela clava TaxID=7725 RepID=UPI00193A3FF9|nr:CCN family member 2-like [Styela clava]
MRILFGLNVFVYLMAYFLVEAQPDEPATQADEYEVFEDELGNESERDFYPTEKKHGLCRECSCPPTPRCEPGVSLITDGCGCCKICAGQLGEKCNRRRVCDHHKGLHCDENTGTCKARPGRSCHVANKWYANGALFSPTCRITCSCIDGDLGCVSKCKPAPPSCAYPRLIRSSGNCCGHWRCSSHPTEAARGGKTSAIFSPATSCMIQTTEWSPCTKTCGFGVSERITNDNDKCKLTKETRLCIVRPCKGNTSPRKPKRSCRKTLRHSKRVRYSISGCLTTKSYRPRYCGTCRHSGKCCKPQMTKTVEMDFRCENNPLSVVKSPSNTYIMKRKMMVILSCVCGDYCINNENEIFSNSIRALRGDIDRTI